ncbi:hypothetical protein MMC19_004186 [Ptychographa xylographoides]|nr:hypothetical protein [Ptychographa xylographoides]
MKSNDDLLGVDCRFEDSDIHTEEQPKFPGNEFPSYMYDTGPRYIFESYMKFANDTDLQCPPRAITPNYTVLIKREGAYNLWHSLMEIFSMYMTMDVLQIAVNNATGGAYFSPSNKANTQILLLDGHDQGPYFGLWSLFTDKPPLRLADLARSERSECLDNVIVPLPGGSNPMWQGDWEAKECEQSILLDTFSRRILNHYHIQEEREPSERLTFTFIDRQQTRKLLHQDRLLLLLKYRYPSIIIQAIDFAALSFPEQIRVIQNTDILAGVHGAGLTHAMFLPPDSSVVEILPAVLLHKGFRNLAKLRGHRYFSDHALTGPDTEDGYRLSEDWQGTDVELDEESFMGLMDVAIQSMLHRGTLASDVS